jgi:hypothetical protein
MELSAFQEAPELSSLAAIRDPPLYSVPNILHPTFRDRVVRSYSQWRFAKDTEESSTGEPRAPRRNSTSVETKKNRETQCGGDTKSRLHRKLR